MRKFIFLIAIIITFGSCEDKELSSIAEILNFTVVDVNADDVNFNQVLIDSESQNVFLMTQDQLKNEHFPIKITSNIEITAGAQITPGSGEVITFDNEGAAFLYTLKAEDLTSYEWHVSMISTQLPNSDFESWYEVPGLDGQNYYEPGVSEGSSIWATANKGTSVYAVYGTTPLEEGENTLVKITTGETLSVPITAGTLFTGKFDIDGAIANPTDPQKATDFGVPFIHRPTSLKIQYKYNPGANYIKATLKDPSSIFGGFDITPLDGNDKCKIFSYLEVREGENSTVVGELEFISGDTKSEMTELILPFNYTSTDTPTHITVLFTSSTDGDLFTGAVGSTLVVDDLELVYE